jgi:hypothetical protein
MKNNATTPANTLPKGTDEIINVAYYAGPNEIVFLGRHWQIEKSQPITTEEWAAMQQRPDLNEYQFKEEK